jgi:hypothetical protein
MPSKRLIFWSTFLGGAGALAAFAEFGPRPETAEVVAVAPQPAPAPRAAGVPAAGSGALPLPLPASPAAPTGAAPAPLLAASAGALFTAQSWERKPPPPSPPPPAAPPPPPAPPAAPPMPFQFMGRLDEGTSTKVFLQNGERLYTASVGDVLEGKYRLTRIDARQLTFLYLPLEQPQTLAVGGHS